MTSQAPHRRLGPRVLQELIHTARMTPPDGLPRVVADALRPAGAEAVRVWVVDYGQRVLTALGAREEPPVDVDSTRLGQVYRMMRSHVETSPDGDHLLVPLIDGVERLGVLELTAPAGTGEDEPAMQTLVAFASCVAELLVTKAQYGDSLARTARTQPMTLAAEMQWQTLPPLTFATDRVVVAGTIEPSYEVGGDAFDYAAEDHRLRFAVLDAMGHGFRASLLSSTAVAAYRNARRSGLSLPRLVEHMDEAVRALAEGDAYVTAVVADLDLDTGVLHWVLAGHPPPLLLRDGRAVETLVAENTLPLGELDLHPTRILPIGKAQLRPEDGVLLYTDGVIEATDRHGTAFGIDRLVEAVGLTATAGLPAPEALREVTLRVLDHQDGVIQDDATQLLVQWLPGGTTHLDPRRPATRSDTTHE